MSRGPFSAEEQRGVYRAIYERRDIRNYRPDAVPEGVLARILEAAHHAPSVGLMQPWDFILVRHPALRRRIYEHFVAVNARASDVYQDDRARAYRALKLQGILDAPLNLVVTCDRRRGGQHVLGRFTMRHMDEYSTCLAVQNLWLAARAEGVGVGWMSLLEPEFLASCLGLPDDVVPVAYLTLGYPVEFPATPMLEATGWTQRSLLSEHVFVDGHGQVDAALRSALDGSTAERRPAEPSPAASARPSPPRPPEAARLRQAELVKPTGSLGRLEALALQLAAIQGAEHPRCERPALLLFAADHGVVAEGVSAYLQCATAQMVYAYLAGGAAVNALCRQHGIELRVADVGVDHDFGDARGLAQYKVRRGTRNFVNEPALTYAELERAVQAGERMVDAAASSDVIALGEMGIGNTTSAAAVFAALTGASAEAVVGLGTGVSSQTLSRKREVIQRGLDRHHPRDPVEALRCLGGLEIAALVGAIEAGARARKLVVLDGFITSVAALVARERTPSVSPYLVAGHLSRERAHRAVLDALGLEPLLDLGLALGEGSGAALAMSLVQSAVRLMREMRTYEEANLVRPLDPRDSDA